ITGDSNSNVLSSLGGADTMRGGGSLAGRFAVDAPNAAVGQFVYVTVTRTLGWDLDGTGGAAIENIAVLQVGATLTINDLLLF
ncbi:MAG TPA: hypothetical protein PK264_17010, partial [Hyphomicrobiaceae bacterium]|nr:hypothetical protein [Hyphomicrobiaceae bacterium]